MITGNYVVGRMAIVIAWARRQDEFDAFELRAQHSLTRRNANQILSRLHRAGVLERVRTGVYRAVR